MVNNIRLDLIELETLSMKYKEYWDGSWRTWSDVDEWRNTRTDPKERRYDVNNIRMDLKQV